MDDPEQPGWFNRIVRVFGKPIPPKAALTIYIFRRAGGWYPLAMLSDQDARNNAECNPGTVKVETTEGRQVWPALTDSAGGV
jgi:hypothetical protein